MDIYQLKKLNSDSFSIVEAKIQRILRKIKINLILQEYLRLYPPGFSPDKFHDAGNIPKIVPSDNIDMVPIGPIGFNINVTTEAKYLAKLLSPLKATSASKR